MTKADFFWRARLLLVAAAGCGILVLLGFADLPRVGWHREDSAFVFGLVCLAYPMVVLHTNRRKRQDDRLPSAVDADKLKRYVLKVAKKRRTKAMLVELDGLMSTLRGKAEQPLDARLRRYVVLVEEMAVRVPTCRASSKVFYDPGGLKLTMVAPRSAYIVRHECLHVFQEATYGVLEVERRGRLGLFAMIVAELEVNYVNDRKFLVSLSVLLAVWGAVVLVAAYGTVRLVIDIAIMT